AAADADIVVEKVEPAEAVQGSGHHVAAPDIVGHVGLVRGRGAALGGDHRDRPLGERQRAVHHENLGPRAGEQHGGGAAIADAVVGGAAARHDGDTPVQSKVVFGSRRHRLNLLIPRLVKMPADSSEEKGPAARRRPKAAGEAYFPYVEPAVEGATKQMGPYPRSSAARPKRT